MEEEIYELKDPINFKNLNLPIIGFEEYGKKRRH